MTPRERWLAILAGKKPDRIPTDMWATPEVLQRLLKDLDCPSEEALWRRLHVDRPSFLDPRPLLEHHPEDPQADLWGIRRRTIAYGTGTYDEVVNPPLAACTTVVEIHAHRWPSPDDFDYAPIAEGVAAADGFRPVKAGTFEPFLLYCALRGLQQGFEDLLLHPGIVDAALGHIFDFYEEQNRRIFEAGNGCIDLTYVAEDLGGQTGPLMSLEVYRRFLLPNQVRMADLARRYGVHVMYHTDGAARLFLPDLLDDVGIEILNPIQWRCPGMEREGLVRDFGGCIAFHGAMDNQRTLPFGSVDDVVAEVKESIELFSGARWICAPCHNLQPVTPTENIVALYETIHDA